MRPLNKGGLMSNLIRRAFLSSVFVATALTGAEAQSDLTIEQVKEDGLFMQRSAPGFYDEIAAELRN